MTVLRLIFAAFLLVQQPEVASPARIGFTVPKAPWMMGVPAGTFEVTQQKLKPDGTAGYFMLTKGTGGLTMSMFIEPVTECITAVACRDWAWKAEQSRLKDIQGVEKSEIGDASVVEYLVPALGKLKIDQKNMHAYFVKEGYWIDVHISKMSYQDADRERFVELIRGIEFSPKKSGGA
jgi:hypothetical protein